MRRKNFINFEYCRWNLDAVFPQFLRGNTKISYLCSKGLQLFFGGGFRLPAYSSNACCYFFLKPYYCTPWLKEICHSTLALKLLFLNAVTADVAVNLWWSDIKMPSHSKCVAASLIASFSTLASNLNILLWVVIQSYCCIIFMYE